MAAGFMIATALSRIIPFGATLLLDPIDGVVGLHVAGMPSLEIVLSGKIPPLQMPNCMIALNPAILASRRGQVAQGISLLIPN